jgi:hypothetical protein
MRHDNSHHILAAAQRRRADTLERARKANSAKPASGAPSCRSPPTPASPAHGSMPSPNCATNSAD